MDSEAPEASKPVVLWKRIAIRAAVGGTAGIVDRIRRGGKDLTLPAGTQLNYQLSRSLEVTCAALAQTAARHDLAASK